MDRLNLLINEIAVDTPLRQMVNAQARRITVEDVAAVMLTLENVDLGQLSPGNHELVTGAIQELQRLFS